MAESPQINDYPSSSDSFQEQIPQQPLFTNSKAGILLQNALEAMNSFGEEAEDHFQETLKELKEIPEEVILELAQAFDDKCQPNAYPTKWGLVYLATVLEHKAAYPFLKRLIFTPIPEERSQLPHSFSTVGEETILRTTAVEGVSYFIRDQKDAQDLLVECTSLPSISIARAAIQTLQKADVLDGKLREKIEATLPRELHYLMKIKPMNVEDVEQIKDPKSHLKPLPKGIKRKNKPRAPRFDSDNRKNNNN